MDQYIALSKKDLQINITLNELYNTHSLLLQHLDTLVGAHRASQVASADGLSTG